MNLFQPLLRQTSLACLVAIGTLAVPGVHAQGLRLSETPLRFGASPGSFPSLASGASLGRAAPVQRPAGYIVALVNSDPITSNEVQTRIARVLEQGGAEAARMPREELGRQVLERLIAERAQLQQARDIGIKVDEATIDQAEETVARQNQITVAELRKRVAQEGLTQAQFRKDLGEQVVFSRLREKEVEPRVRITDLEVDQYINDQRANPDASAPQDINLAQILVAVPENATPAQVAILEKRAEALAARARGTEEFAKIAKEVSDSTDRNVGGVMGLRSVGRYPPSFVDATASLAVGGIAGPLRSSAGFHVLKVLAKAQAGLGDAAVTQTQVRHILLRNDAKRSTADAIALLAGFKRRIEAGTADFATLARENSQDGSAKEGGELGWRRSGEFVPEFDEAVARLAPGQMSEPLVSRFGVHLIQVEGRRESKPTQAELRDVVRAQLREKKLDEAYESWAQELRARAYVEYREAPQS